MATTTITRSTVGTATDGNPMPQILFADSAIRTSVAHCGLFHVTLSSTTGPHSNGGAVSDPIQ